MLLKLLLPPYNRVIEGAFLVKWHKGEGDRISYGDDLCDLEVRRVRQTNVEEEVGQPIVDYAQRLARQLQQLGPDEEPAPFPGGGRIRFHQQCRFVLRICSSDVGVLRLIQAREGEFRCVGEILAVLTSQADEPVDTAPPALARASVFRVIANPL